jgi:peptide/nickel transport system substrate-binding protein
MDRAHRAARVGANSKSYTFAPYTLTQGAWDPANNVDLAKGWEQDGIYEGLIAYRPSGHHWIAENVLAESIDLSSDGKRIQFTLKKGVPFQKGFGELTASDVKYSLERAAGIQRLFPGAPKSQVGAGQALLASLERVVVTGKYSGVIVLKHPDATMMDSVLPYSCVSNIVSEKAFTKYGSNAVSTVHGIAGTGPYEITEYTPNQSFAYSRVDNWSKHWPRPAYWDEIKYVLGAPAAGQPSTVPLEAGEADFDAFPSVDEFLHFQNSANIKGLITPTLSVSYLAMNIQYPTLSDVRVRQAIRYAIDYDSVLKLAHVGAGGRATSLLGVAYGPQWKWRGARRYDQNLSQARQLMKSAGVSGFSIEMLSDLYPAAAGVAEVIQANLAEIGINAKIITEATYPSNWWSDPKVTQLSLTTGGGSPDPTSQFFWYQCNQIGQYNSVQWCNPSYTTLYNKLLSETNQATRTAIVAQMDTLIDEMAGFAFLYYPNYYYLSSKRITMAYDLAGNIFPTWAAPA